MKKNDRIHSISGESDKVIPIRPGITTSANDDENPASKAAWCERVIKLHTKSRCNPLSW